MIAQALNEDGVCDAVWNKGWREWRRKTGDIENGIKIVWECVQRERLVRSASVP
jgi:hypothetical protein